MTTTLHILARAAAVLAIGVLAGCAPSSPATALAAAAPVCAGSEEKAGASAEAAKLRTSVENGPLFGAASARGLKACRVSRDDGATVLHYEFRDGGSLTAKHDPAIEFNEQIARFAKPPAGDPLIMLKAIERANFGDEGCGIDWKQPPEIAPAPDDPAAREAIYRGDSCNCQERLRRDAEGRVIGLTVRSAC